MKSPRLVVVALLSALTVQAAFAGDPNVSEDFVRAAASSVSQEVAEPGKWEACKAWTQNAASTIGQKLVQAKDWSVEAVKEHPYATTGVLGTTALGGIGYGAYKWHQNRNAQAENAEGNTSAENADDAADKAGYLAVATQWVKDHKKALGVTGGLAATTAAAYAGLKYFDKLPSMPSWEQVKGSGSWLAGKAADAGRWVWSKQTKPVIATEVAASTLASTLGASAYAKLKRDLDFKSQPYIVWDEVKGVCQNVTGAVVAHPYMTGTTVLAVATATGGAVKYFLPGTFAKVGTKAAEYAQKAYAYVPNQTRSTIAKETAAGLGTAAVAGAGYYYRDAICNAANTVREKLSWGSSESSEGSEGTQDSDEEARRVQAEEQARHDTSSSDDEVVEDLDQGDSSDDNNDAVLSNDDQADTSSSDDNNADDGFVIEELDDQADSSDEKVTPKVDQSDNTVNEPTLSNKDLRRMLLKTVAPLFKKVRNAGLQDGQVAQVRALAKEGNELAQAIVRHLDHPKAAK